jgi:hypothetical protein
MVRESCTMESVEGEELVPGRRFWRRREESRRRGEHGRERERGRVCVRARGTSGVRVRDGLGRECGVELGLIQNES